MRTRRTGRTLLARLERLELLAMGVPETKLILGNVRRLPKDYRGERHTVIAKHLPNQGDQEWVEFEEVPVILALFDASGCSTGSPVLSFAGYLKTIRASATW
jgi:hypothetical protein